VSAADGLRIDTCVVAITEIGAARGRAAELRTRMRDIVLPEIGRVAIDGQRLLLCVRPARWLVIASPGTTGLDAASVEWRQAGDALAGVVDLSAAYTAFLLQGLRRAEVLARGCRLDLDPQMFATGSAAATIIAQTQVHMAALPIGMLLLAPASLARHFSEWLAAAASPFGLMPQSSISVAGLCRNNES